MQDQTIICPNCGRGIPLTETLFRQVEENLRKEFEEKIKGERERLKQEAKKEAEKALLIELKDLKEQIAEKTKT